VQVEQEKMVQMMAQLVVLHHLVPIVVLLEEQEHLMETMETIKEELAVLALVVTSTSLEEMAVLVGIVL
jgi:hypothetical protein